MTGDRDTRFGFWFGPACVERCISHKGYVVFEVRTKRRVMQVHVTPSGLIRTHERKRRKDEALSHEDYYVKAHSHVV